MLPNSEINYPSQHRGRSQANYHFIQSKYLYDHRRLYDEETPPNEQNTSNRSFLPEIQANNRLNDSNIPSNADRKTRSKSPFQPRSIRDQFYDVEYPQPEQNQSRRKSPFLRANEPLHIEPTFENPNLYDKRRSNPNPQIDPLSVSRNLLMSERRAAPKNSLELPRNSSKSPMIERPHQISQLPAENFEMDSKKSYAQFLLGQMKVNQDKKLEEKRRKQEADRQWLDDTSFFDKFGQY